MGVVPGTQKELHCAGWLKGTVPGMVDLAQVQGAGMAHSYLE